MSLFFGAQQATWLQNFYQELSFPLDSPITIHCDSQPAITIIKNKGDHTHSKHFNIKYHTVWEQVANREIKVEYIETKSNPADVFTKALSADLTSSATENLRLQTLDSVLNTTYAEQSFYQDPDKSWTTEDQKALLLDT